MESESWIDTKFWTDSASKLLILLSLLGNEGFNHLAELLDLAAGFANLRFELTR